MKHTQQRSEPIFTKPCRAVAYAVLVPLNPKIYREFGDKDCWYIDSVLKEDEDGDFPEEAECEAEIHSLVGDFEVLKITLCGKQGFVAKKITATKTKKSKKS